MSLAIAKEVRARAVARCRPSTILLAASRFPVFQPLCGMGSYLLRIASVHTYVLNLYILMSLSGTAAAAGGGACDIDNSIFSTGDQLNEKPTMWSLIALIVFTVFFEVGLHQLEHHVRHQPNYLVILGKIYKELMILGFISFILFVCIQLCVLEHGENLVAFEYAHIIIFFVALVLVVQAVRFNLYAVKVKHFYTITAKIEEQNLISNFANEKDSRFFWNSSLRERMEFQIMRKFFLDFYGLPFHFDFAAYAREALNERMLSVMEISVSSWLLLILFCLLNIARLSIAPKPSSVCDEAAHRMLITVRRLGGDTGTAACEAVDAAHRALGEDAADDSHGCEDGTAHRMLRAGMRLLGSDAADEASTDCGDVDTGYCDDYPCADEAEKGAWHTLWTTMLPGWMLMFGTIGLIIGTEVVMKRILRKQNVFTKEDYGTVLEEIKQVPFLRYASLSLVLHFLPTRYIVFERLHAYCLRKCMTVLFFPSVRFFLA
jgi:hypothetical protein